MYPYISFHSVLDKVLGPADPKPWGADLATAVSSSAREPVSGAVKNTAAVIKASTGGGQLEALSTCSPGRGQRTVVEVTGSLPAP